MAGYQPILLDKNPVQYSARVTINRPERRNALNDLTMDELGNALEERPGTASWWHTSA